jgi:hypothetical protein
MLDGRFQANQHLLMLLPHSLSQNNMLSSANKRWFTVGAELATCSPYRLDDGSLLLDFKRHGRPSAASKYK